MRLNIGCGYRHLKGYVNIDADMDSVADLVMEAHDLQPDSSTVDEIMATQLIEHLGFFKGKYFLSECFRVLRPGGLLTLETPDVERTFEVFLAGTREAREASLSWVHGSESRGMRHLFCFPADLLRELAVETGFRVQSEEFFPYQRHRPALRLILEKPSGEHRKEFFAELRKRMVVKKLPAFDDELTAACQEDVLLRLASTGQDDWRALLRLTVHSAEIVREYFGLEAGRAPSAGRYEAVAAYLAEQRFQDLLVEMLKANQAGAGFQDSAYRQTLERGMAIAEELVQGKRRELPSANVTGTRVFLPSILKAGADRAFARGIREFNLGRYADALDLFHSSSALFRDNPFPYWNAARTYELLGNGELARQQYGMARTAMGLYPRETVKQHLEALADEMRNVGIHSSRKR
jgi:hypothetical protein